RRRGPVQGVRQGGGRGLPARPAHRRSVAVHQGQTLTRLNRSRSDAVHPMTERASPAPDDQPLVRAAQQGDTAAYEELVARHRDKVYARAYSMMRNEEDALDLSQEAWVKGWQRLKQFQGESSYATWMSRIVINLCLDQLRRQKRQRAESIE